MVLQERLYTVADLREIENLPGNEEKWFELIKGVIHQHCSLLSHATHAPNQPHSCLGRGGEVKRKS